MGFLDPLGIFGGKKKNDVKIENNNTVASQQSTQTSAPSHELSKDSSSGNTDSTDFRGAFVDGFHAGLQAAREYA
jgi:hypothetical protein